MIGEGGLPIGWCEECDAEVEAYGNAGYLGWYHIIEMDVATEGGPQAVEHTHYLVGE